MAFESETDRSQDRIDANGMIVVGCGASNFGEVGGKKVLLWRLAFQPD